MFPQTNKTFLEKIQNNIINLKDENDYCPSVLDRAFDVLNTSIANEVRNLRAQNLTYFRIT